MPPQITCASALPGKTRKHENHFFYSNAVLVESAAAVGLCCMNNAPVRCKNTNFRLLANQWAERRLVMQWRHGCRAMRRSVQRRCFQWGSVPLRSDIKGTELPPATMLIPLERQLNATTLSLTVFI